MPRLWALSAWWLLYIVHYSCHNKPGFSWSPSSLTSFYILETPKLNSGGKNSSQQTARGKTISLSGIELFLFTAAPNNAFRFCWWNAMVQGAEAVFAIQENVVHLCLKIGTSITCQVVFWWIIRLRFTLRYVCTYMLLSTYTRLPRWPSFT